MNPHSNQLVYFHDDSTRLIAHTRDKGMVYYRFITGLLASVDLKPLKSELQCTNKNPKLRLQDFSSYMEYQIVREADDICSLNSLLGFTQRFGQQDMISRK